MPAGRVELAEQPQHVDLAGGQASGINPRGQRPGTELVKHRERGQQLLRIWTFRQYGRVLLRASRGLPGRGGLTPPACRLHRAEVVTILLIQSPGLSPIGGLSRISQTASAPGEDPARTDFRTGKDTTSTRHGQSLGHIS